jgi:cobalamin transport system substrate-binding protein
MEFKSRANTANEPGGRFRQRRIPAICAGLALAFLITCARPVPAQSRTAQDAPAKISATHAFTDEIGRRVNVPWKTNRIVSLAPNLTEIVFALGEGDHLAGDTDFCDYPAEAAQKPHVGGPVNPNLEEIVKLAPDLILATSINRRETVDALDRLGYPVYTIDPHSVDEMIRSVKRLGSVLDAEKSAAALVGNMRTTIADLDRRLAGIAPRRVLFVVWTDPLISIGRGTFIADALRHAGAQSVVDTAVKWPHISLEEIIHLQPQALIFATAHDEDTRRDIAALRTQPGWRDLNALRHGNVILVSDAINRPAPRMVDAIEQLARALHPEAFAAQAAAPPGIQPAIEEACACAR